MLREIKIIGERCIGGLIDIRGEFIIEGFESGIKPGDIIELSDYLPGILNGPALIVKMWEVYFEDHAPGFGFEWNPSV